MSAMASQITILMSVYSIVYSGADERKHQSSASLAFVRETHRWPVIFPHKGQWRGKCFHLMKSSCCEKRLCKAMEEEGQTKSFMKQKRLVLHQFAVEYMPIFTQCGIGTISSTGYWLHNEICFDVHICTCIISVTRTPSYTYKYSTASYILNTY